MYSHLPADPPASRESSEPDRPEPSQPASVVAPTAPRPRGRWRAAAIPVALLLVTLLGGSGLFVAGFALGSQRATTAGTPAELQQEFAPFWEAYQAITNQYVGSVDRQALLEGAIGGLFKAINDPYSGYLTPEEYKQSTQGISGQFEGIGAEIGTEATDGSGSCNPISATCRMVVIAPLDGSPAQTAGLKAGDVIVAIDSASTDGLTLDEAVAKVRGQRGTQVTLSVQRSGVSAPIQLTITRDVIVVKDVSSKTLQEGTVGYLRIAHFSENVGKDFRTALQGLLDQGIKSYVLDLRGDPGGFVQEAVSVASEFIPAGQPLFWEEYAGGKELETTATQGGLATDPTIKLVVLVDKGSASASEIVAGALKENGRGTLVGETTFGKGTVQEWQLLSNDAGGFRLSIAKWLTPDKNWINGTGIQPDVAVNSEGAAAGSDPVLAKAVDLLSTASAALPESHAGMPAPA